MNHFKTLCVVVTAFNLFACTGSDSSGKKDTAATEIAPHESMEKLPHSHYPSVSAMIDSSGDYASDEGTFQVISENPLHIRISQLKTPGSSLEEMQYEAKDGIVYIAFKAFACTDIKEITITSVPKIYDPANEKDLGFNKQASYTATIKKDVAQQVMQKYTGLNNFDDLLGEEAGGLYFENSPNDEFEKLKSGKNIDEVLSMLTKK